MTRCRETCASTEVNPRGTKIRLINVVFLRILSEIKLKRTDTTLDLSQKAKRAGEEKKKKIKERRASRPLYTVGLATGGALTCKRDVYFHVSLAGSPFRQASSVLVIPIG